MASDDGNNIWQLCSVAVLMLVSLGVLLLGLLAFHLVILFLKNLVVILLLVVQEEAVVLLDYIFNFIEQTSEHRVYIAILMICFMALPNTSFLTYAFALLNTCHTSPKI